MAAFHAGYSAGRADREKVVLDTRDIGEPSDHGGPVIVLGAKPSEIQQQATVIRDAGKTEVEPGTVTAGTDWAWARQGEPSNAQVHAAAVSLDPSAWEPGPNYRSETFSRARDSSLDRARIALLAAMATS